MKKPVLNLVASAMLIAGLGACSSQPKKYVLDRLPQQPVETAAEQDWRVRATDEIAPGFELELSNSADSAINGKYRVEADGKLKLPYDVEIDAAGITTSALEGKIQSAYKKYLVNPKIDVEVLKKEYYVDVRGLVKKPGKYLVETNSSLDELISKAEGLQQNADQTVVAQYAKIEQGPVSKTIMLRDYFAGNRELIPAWQGGETVFLQSEKGAGAVVSSKGSRNYIQFLGEVRQPGEYPFKNDSDFFDYLIKAGGPTERADMNNIALLRNNGDQREMLNFDITKADKIPALNPGDTLIVHSDSPSALEKDTRVVGGFAGIISALATVVVLILAV